MLSNGPCSPVEGFNFNVRMLNNFLSNSIDMDLIFFDKFNDKYYFVELLRTGPEQARVTPFTSHPNNYFYFLKNGGRGNRLKFILQDLFSKEANAKYICVNYAKTNDPNDNLIKVMHIKNVSWAENTRYPVQSIDSRKNRLEFKTELLAFLEGNCVNLNT